MIACRCVLATVVAAIAVAGASTAPADAAEYSARICHQAPTDYGNGSAAGWNYTRKGLEPALIACPAQGLSFDTDSAKPLGWHEDWMLDLPVASIGMTVAAGAPEAGYRYALVDCRTAPCETVAELPVSPDGPVEVPPVVGPANWQLRIRASCEAVTCLATPSLRMFNFEIKARDDDPPYAYSYLQPHNAWLQPGFVSATIYAGDSASGVAYANASVEGHEDRPSMWGSYCYLPPDKFATAEGLCPKNPPRFVGGLDLGGLDDGPHRLHLSAVDAVGNQIDSFEEFKIDGTPPSEPSDVKVAGQNELGWTVASSTVLSWNNLTEQAIPTSTQSGIVRATVDVLPQAPAGVDPPPVVSMWMSSASLQLPSDGEWRVDVWTTDRAENDSPKARLTVRRDTATPRPPDLERNPFVGKHALSDGYRQRWQPPAVPASGTPKLCGYAFTVDRLPGTDPAVALDLPASANDVPLSERLPDGDNYFHIRSVSCAMRGSTTATELIRVDATPPALTLAGAPLQEWSRTTVPLTIDALDAGSGLDSISYSIDNGQAAKAPKGPVSLKIADGSHVVEYSAIDVTGNASATESVSVKVDQHAPTVQIDPVDLVTPTTITAQVEDAGSGVADAWLEYRRIDGGASDGGSAWSRLTFGSKGGAHVELSGRMPENELSDGVYAVRAIAIDRAGGLTVASRANLDGAEVLISLPTYERPLLSAKIAPMRRRCSGSSGGCSHGKCVAKRSGCRQRLVIDSKSARGVLAVNFGSAVSLVGYMRRPTGQPMRGESIAIYSAVSERLPELMATTTTDANGRYEVRIPRGPTRTFQARFAAARAESPFATLQVRAGVTLKLSPARVRIGHQVRLSGRLSSGELFLPVRGKLIQPQFYNGDRWDAVKETLRTDSSGRFWYKFPFKTKPDKPTTLWFRVAAPAEGDWPYEDGYSLRRKVTVLP